MQLLPLVDFLVDSKTSLERSGMLVIENQLSFSQLHLLAKLLFTSHEVVAQTSSGAISTLA